MMVSRKSVDLLTEFKNAGVLVSDGHFVLKSGRHSSNYFNEKLIYNEPDLRRLVCHKMGELIAEHVAPGTIDYIVVGSTGGYLLGYSAISYVKFDHDTPMSVLLLDKDDDRTSLAGSKVLVLDDIVVTGSTLREQIRLVKEREGEVVGAFSMVNFGVVEPQDLCNVPLYETLLNLRWTSWRAFECPMCAHNTQIRYDLGRGRDFV